MNNSNKTARKTAPKKKKTVLITMGMHKGKEAVVKKELKDGQVVLAVSGREITIPKAFVS